MSIQTRKELITEIKQEISDEGNGDSTYLNWIEKLIRKAIPNYKLNSVEKREKAFTQIKEELSTNKEVYDLTYSYLIIKFDYYLNSNPHY